MSKNPLFNALLEMFFGYLAEEVERNENIEEAADNALRRLYWEVIAENKNKEVSDEEAGYDKEERQ